MADLARGKAEHGVLRQQIGELAARPRPHEILAVQRRDGVAVR